MDNDSHNKSSVEDSVRQMSPLQRALLAVREMRAKLDAVERARTEPIAVIGIGCRFPGGVSGPEGYWRLLRDGVNGVSEIPPERWDRDSFYDPDPEAPGKMNTRHGGFIEGVDLFDAHFFGISAREAAAMDPQHRLLLHVAHEALDDGGQPVDRLAGSATGVFIGSSLSEYAWLNLRAREGASCYTATGSFGAIAANRISYLFDLRGPSYTVDAVCSASLLAVHLACQSLRNGECSMALAGGAGLSLTPDGIIWFTKLGATCADGKCKAFDAGADGIVLAEGVAVVVLKPLQRALDDGDRIYAVIRGSAVAQDGRSNGLTAPTRHAQEAMLRAAYKDARVDPSRVQYVETHGTGTILGDPIEALALGSVLGEGRPPERPCFIGSVKTNLGHTQMVGGVAGLIKVALSLEQRALPASLHFERPNPHIPFEDLRLKVQTSFGPWPYDEPMLAGVTSLSFGGTNVHVVMEEAPPAARPALPSPDRARLLPLSARSRDALTAMAGAYRRYAADADTPPSLHDVCYTASVRRSHFEHRLAFTFRSREDLCGALDAVLAGGLHPGVAAGKKALRGASSKVAFVFSGQGSQWARMGMGLLGEEPAFSEAIARCDEALRRYVDWSVIEELSRPEAESRLGELDVIQSTLFATQVSIAALWRSWGIEPAAVVGHSMGEVAAAHVAGALSLDDAARVVSTRSALIRRTSGQGAMALCGISIEEAEEILARGYGDRLSIAAENGTRSVVLAGAQGVVAEVMEALKRKNVFTSWIKSDAAGHCALMDPLLDELIASLAGIAPESPAVPMYSTVSGAVVLGPALDARYWARNMRDTVRFAGAIRRLADDGHHVFLEISPHPILIPSIEQVTQSRGEEALLLPSWRRGEEERAAMLGALGAFYAAGHPVDWSRLYPDRGRVVALPSYPWQGKRHWIDVGGAAPAANQAGALADETDHLTAGQRPALVRLLEEQPPERRRGALVDVLQDEVARVLGLEPSERPGPDDGFFAIGMTSLQAVELKRQLESALGRSLPSTLAFEHPTVDALAGYLLVALALEDRAAPAPRAEELGAGRWETAEEELSRLPEVQLLDLLDSELDAIDSLVGVS